MKKLGLRQKRSIPRVDSQPVHQYAARFTGVSGKARDLKKSHLELQEHLNKIGFEKISTKKLHTAFTRLTQSKHPGGLSHRTFRRELNRSGLKNVPTVIAYRVLQLSARS